MGEFLKRYLANERGATSIEYAVIATGISIAIIAAVAAIGTSVKGRFDLVATGTK